jgi:hypothetical protein
MPSPTPKRNASPDISVSMGLSKTLTLSVPLENSPTFGVLNLTLAVCSAPLASSALKDQLLLLVSVLLATTVKWELFQPPLESNVPQVLTPIL